MKAGIYKTPNGNLIYVAKDRTIKATTLKPSTWPGVKVSQRGEHVVFLDVGLCERVDDVPNGCTDHQGWLDAFAVGFLRRENMSTRPVPVRLSPAAAQLLVQSDNAARAQGEMVHKLIAEGYVEVPGTDELVKAGADFVTADPLNFEVSDKPQYEYIGNVPNLHFTTGDADPLKLDARERHFAIFESTPGSGVEGFLKYAEQCNVVIDRNEAVDMADAWTDAFLESLKLRGWGICHDRSARKHRKRGDTVIPLSGGLFAWKRVAWRWHGTQTGSTRLFDAPENLPRHEEVADYRVRPAPNWPFVRNMTYVGPIEHLKGKTALVKKTHSPGNVLAQFDDPQASLTGEPVELIGDKPPTFALGYSWHAFSAFDFSP